MATESVWTICLITADILSLTFIRRKKLSISGRVLTFSANGRLYALTIRRPGAFRDCIDEVSAAKCARIEKSEDEEEESLPDE